MNKQRLEFLSDGIFAIVFTLLIIEIHVPEFEHSPITNAELWHALVELTPLFVSYYVSFLVLAMFWIAHHALYGLFTKNIDRSMILLNFFYLCMIAFVPFSAHLIGRYSHNELSFLVYGLNILAIGGTNLLMFKYAVYSQEIDTSALSPRLFRQAHIRLLLTPAFALLGIATVFVSFPIALFFFGFPILFNIFPGGLNFLEKKFRFQL